MLEVLTKAGDNLQKVNLNGVVKSIMDSNEVESKFCKLLSDKTRLDSKRRIYASEPILYVMIDRQIKPLVLEMFKTVVAYKDLQPKTLGYEIANPFKAAFRVSFFFIVILCRVVN